MEALFNTIRSFGAVSKITNLTNNGQAFIGKYLEIVVSRWHRLRDVWLVLHYARISVAVLLIGGALLVMPQGRELAMRIDSDLVQFIWFFVGLFFWSLQNWFGTRRLLQERFGRPDDGDKSVFAISLRHVPRIMGAAAYLFATLALVIAWNKKGFSEDSLVHGLITLIVTLTGVLFYYLVIKRTAWMPKGNDDRFDDIEFIHRYLKPATNFYSLFLLAAGIFFPAAVGFWMGSLAILSFGLSSMVPLGNWAIRYTERLTDPNFGSDKPNDKSERTAGFPVVTSLVMLALILSFFNDNHDIRSLSTTSHGPSLDEAFNSWREQAAQSNGIKPIVIVATAGGGIRASFWTATVLGGLTDLEPKFRNSLFAISGVSGGSVGSVFYAAALKELASNCDSLSGERARRGNSCYEGLIQNALSYDFLAPNLSSLLYSDLIQRFLPPLGFPDRQQALERGWEFAFERNIRPTKTEGLAAPLAEQAGGEWLPMLLLNSTHMESGKRVVASSMKLSDAFTDTVDLQEVIGKDVRLSTAAGNSARFTYVSPAGTLPCKPTGKLLSDLWNKLACRNGHVVDGGYFENFGAITALQILKAVSSSSNPEIARGRQQIKPIVIVISSDPLLACSPDRKKEDDECDDSLNRDGMPDYLRHERGANESLGPVKTLLATRSARGILASKELHSWVKTCKGPGFCGFGDSPEFFHLPMEVPTGKPDPALGWMLSEESERLIQHVDLRLER